MATRMKAILLVLLMTGTIALAAGEKNTPPAKASTQTTKASMGTAKAPTGTEDEQIACTPDATKFCADKIPDTFAVLACLQAHRQRLSKACRHVLEENGQ